VPRTEFLERAIQIKSQTSKDDARPFFLWVGQPGTDPALPPPPPSPVTQRVMHAAQRGASGRSGDAPAGIGSRPQLPPPLPLTSPVRVVAAPDELAAGMFSPVKAAPALPRAGPAKAKKLKRKTPKATKPQTPTLSLNTGVTAFKPRPRVKNPRTSPTLWGGSPDGSSSPQNFEHMSDVAMVAKYAIKLQSHFKRFRARRELEIRRAVCNLDRSNFSQVQLRMNDVMAMAVLPPSALGQLHEKDGGKRSSVVFMSEDAQLLKHTDLNLLYAGNYRIQEHAAYVSVLQTSDNEMRVVTMYYKSKSKYSFTIAEHEWRHIGVLPSGGLGSAGRSEKVELCRKIVQAITSGEFADMREDMKEHLEWIGITPGLRNVVNPQGLEDLAAKMTKQFASSGEVIISQGDHGDGMYFLTSGCCKLVRDEKTVDITEAPSFFGEAALLSGGVRSSSVVATSGCQLLFLKKADFVAATKMFPSLCASGDGWPNSKIEDWLAAIPGIKGSLNRRAQLDLMSKLQKRQVSPGHCFMRRGDQADGMYFVMDGSVAIKVAGRVADTISAPNFFGDSALQRGGAAKGGDEHAARRNADVFATTVCSVLFLGKQDYRDVVARSPQFLLNVESGKKPSSRLALGSAVRKINAARRLSAVCAER
jgi:CRP-like cAMP-binding protein